MRIKRIITTIIAIVLLLNVFPCEVKALSKGPSHNVPGPCTQVINGTDVVKGCYTLVVRPEARGLSQKEMVEFYSKNDDILGFVNRFYKKTLNRNADWNGLLFWAGIIVGNKNGKGIQYMATEGFFKSKEFINKDVKDAEFIDICYQAFLNRNPDTNGKKYWLNVIKNIGRDNVVKGFVDSIEFKLLIKKYMQR